jgi:hypothetical protein
MLDFVTRPIRWAFGVTENEVVETVRETHDMERDTLGAVEAIEHATASVEKHVTAVENATASIEKHVTVMESLATSVDPLRASVDRLTDTMQDLVKMLGPVAAAEREAQKVGRVFHRHHEKPPPAQDQS